jgi:acetyl-CoA acetyltransferase
MPVMRAILDKKTGEAIAEEDACIDRDEYNRPDTTLEGLLALPPVFDTTSGEGSVTAGNASQLSDGASATLLMSGDRARALGVAAVSRSPRASPTSWASVRCSPCRSC